jgi:heme-degrading monooxygenase HmoA
MNRFRVARGREEGFLGAWRERESLLHEVPGFVRFRLLAGEPGDGFTRFISCSEWRSRADFVAWTESPAFSRAHGRARLPEGTLLGHPEFEGYEVAEERVG